jgi:hypothetical protein
MEAKNIDVLLQEATRLLELAENETYRSKEDVASFLICHNSRQALINSMSYYLIKNNIILIEPVTADSLWKQCQEQDGRFQEVNMSTINCKHEENSERYCLSVNKVSSCYDTAKIIYGIATEEAPGY